MERKSLTRFLDTSADEDNVKHAGSPTESTKDNALAIRQWLTEHQSTKPIAGALFKRTRFTGLHNNSAGGIWATLDRDVCFTESLYNDLQDDDWTVAARSESAKKFPHAILEIRREGNQATSLIQTLDRSHLVRQIPTVYISLPALMTPGRACPRFFFGSTHCMGLLQAECHACAFLGRPLRQGHPQAAGACQTTESKS